MRSALLLLLAIALALPARTARADDTDTQRAKTHLRAGVAYYDEAKYEDALREMEAAYRLRPLADLQYNIANCHERLGHSREAVAAYKKYLEGKPNADDKDEVAARIKNLEERAAKETGTGPQIVEKEKVVLKEVVVYRDAPPKPGRAARGVAIGCGVLALGAAAAGITFAVLAKRDADAVTSGGNASMPVAFEGAPSQTQAAGQQDRVLSYVSFGVAAAAAAGAVGFWIYGDRLDRDAAKQLALAPAVVPMAGPTGGGLVVAGVF